MLGVYMWTKLQGDTEFTNKIMGCQVHAIEKAIRPLFTDWVTNVFLKFDTGLKGKSTVLE